MGFNIYIGNGISKEDDDLESVIVDRIEQNDAPTFPNDEATGNSNNRHPDYGIWRDFCDITGLGDLFFNDVDGLMHEGPGFTTLQNHHAQVIKSALKAWEAKHAKAVPGFEGDFWKGHNKASGVGYDGTFARLIWLDWWVTWALKNCEHPGIYNF